MLSPKGEAGPRTRSFAVLRMTLRQESNPLIVFYRNWFPITFPTSARKKGADGFAEDPASAGAAQAIASRAKSQTRRAMDSSQDCTRVVFNAWPSLPLT